MMWRWNKGAKDRLRQAAAGLLTLVLCLVLLTGSVLAEKRVVRVGYIDNPYFLTQHEDGTYSGVLFDFMEMVGAYAGVQMEYVRGDIPTNNRRLLSGEIDLLPGVMRSSKGVTSKYPLSTHAMSVTTMQAAMRDRQAIAEGRRLRIGYFAPGVQIEPLLPEIAHHMKGYEPGFELVPFDIPGTPDQAYMAGEIDGVITNTFHPEPEQEDVFSLSTDRTYMAFHPGDEELKQRIDEAMQDVLLSNPDFENKLKLRPPVSFTPAEREYLATLDHLTVFISADQKPYTWFENGEAKGLIRDIVDMISEDIGVPITVLESKDNNEMFRRFADGEADLVADFNSDNNWARKHHAIVTSPYLMLSYVAVVRRDREQPEKPMVACVRGHYYTKQFVEKEYPEEQRIYFNTIHECLEAVSKGTADITYEKSITAQYDITNGEFYNLTSTGGVAFSHGVSLVLHEDADPRLLSILNKAITHIDHEKIQGSINGYMLASKSDRGLVDIVLRNPVASVQSLLAAFGVLVLVMGGYLYMRYRSDRRLRDWAFVNQQTGLHTLSWFHQYAFEEVRDRRKAHREGRLWVMALAPQRFLLMKESYDQKLLFEAMKAQVNDVCAKYPWMLQEAVTAGLTALCVLCEMPEGKTPEDLAQDLQGESNTIDIGNVRTSLNLRFGFCQVPSHDITQEDFNRLVEWALLAQDEAIKRDVLFLVYDNAMRNEVMQQQKIEHYMQKGITDWEFKVWLQPKYDIRTQKLVGAEALVRWQSPELGLLQPAQFVDIFEMNGFIVNLDYYMLERVLEIQQYRYDQGLPMVPISVNQSGLHITEAGYLEKMEAMLAKFHIPPKSIELEITETAFIDFTTKQYRENASSIIESLQQMGYRTSMDDFCTGYSSIAMLRNLPMDVMKIDRSMLLAAEADPRAEKILHYVISMGTALGMRVICEGIETKEQERMLLKHGCFYGQGYRFGKPMTLDAFHRRFHDYGV